MIRPFHLAPAAMFFFVLTVAHAQSVLLTRDGTLSTVQGAATFSSLNRFTPIQALKAYTEGGMLFTSDGGMYPYYEFVPYGLTDSHFFYASGTYDRYGIRRTDGLPFSALQFDAANSSGGVSTYLWIEALRNGQSVGEFDLDIDMWGSPIRNHLMLTGDFDELRLISYRTAEMRDAHLLPPNNPDFNLLVIDNVRYGLVPEPALSLSVCTFATLALRRRRIE